MVLEKPVLICLGLKEIEASLVTIRKPIYKLDGRDFYSCSTLGITPVQVVSYPYLDEMSI